MPRDRSKIEYWIIPVEKDSVLHRSIVEDAENLGMTNVIPKMIMIRLAEFYSQKRNQQRNHPDKEVSSDKERS